MAVAARKACELAKAEHLPIEATLTGNPERWHAEAILKTIPVVGTRDGRRERVPAGMNYRLDSESRSLEAGGTQWNDLAVEREDFERYANWLRSLW